MAADNVMSIEQVEAKWRQSYADASSLYKGNMDAMVAASQAVISGYQSLSAEMLAFLQSRMKTGLETTQRLASCGSPESMIELQVEYTKSACTAYAEEVKKLSELSGKIITDAVAPLGARAKAVPAKMAESAAA
jgi:phasin family protein